MTQQSPEGQKGDVIAGQPVEERIEPLISALGHQGGLCLAHRGEVGKVQVQDVDALLPVVRTVSFLTRSP